MTEAKFYRKLDNNTVLCYLCPRECRIHDGQAGFCFVRKNENGRLLTLAYNSPYAVHIDPIEKKPLFHFLPGTSTLSIGTAGCNLGCKFCQNWDISKARYDQNRAVDFTPEAAVDLALREGCASLAYTYNDPTIWAEYAMAIAERGRRAGLKNVMVTAGYITAEVIETVYANMDAANVDLKAFTEDFYHKITLSHLEPVLQTLKTLQRLGVWVEITNLKIPTLNDSTQETRAMVQWILDNLGPDVPLHFTGFHPDFKLNDLPATPATMLEDARLLAMEMGLHYVYVGNVQTRASNNTYCPNCKRLLIERHWHTIAKIDLTGNRCQCGQAIPITVAPGTARPQKAPRYIVFN